MRRAALVTVVALAILPFATAPARADVTVLPSTLPTSATGTTITISVVAKQPANPVNKIQLVFPNSLSIARLVPPEGWAEQQLDSTNYAVSGPARTGRIDVGVSLGKTPTFPSNLPINVLQFHTNGEVVRWIEYPSGEYQAGVLSITAPVAVSVSSAAPAAALTPSTAATAPSFSSLAALWALGGGTLVVVGAVGVLLLARRRRRTRPSGNPAAVPDAPQTTPLTPAAIPPATSSAPVSPAAPATSTPASSTPASSTPASSTPTAELAAGVASAPHLSAPTEAAAELVTTPGRVGGEGEGGQVRLAIDYGTSNTVALLRWPDGRVRPLLFDSSPLLPSAVQDVDGRLVAGRDALNAARSDPAAHEQNPKRRITDVHVLLGGHEHDIADLVAATLRRVADEAQRVTGAPVPAGTVLTHPAGWGTIRREILVDAAARAGLSDPVLVAEPVAAAAYFAQVLGRALAPGQSVVIFDLGAGTFDVTVVRKGDRDDLDILAADGLDDLGGLDFDALVVDLIGTQATTQATGQAEAWQRLRHPQTPADRRFARLLWDDARGAKETLSRLSTAAVSVPSLDLDTHVTREQFEAAARPLLIRAVRATAAVLRAANVAEDTIAGLFLVGGSTRVPLVATLLFQELRIRPVVLEQPEIVVAEGALRHARYGHLPG
ncbi:Hsp70 family protein [Dactylosporangium sp. NPDC049525]|uniref:Hsp70 family protein n=1 Tax=Dactylosporangium sp. NPDC049525 TaxID=3154730 RepID=UPI00341B110A